MQEPLDALETRIAELRRAIRGALTAREQDRVRELRAELRRAERSWDALVTPPNRPEEDRQGLASLLPAREQVHQALTLLGAPAAPKLIAAVHAAFFTGQLTPSRLASLRRDEERSYRAAPGARPYYLCPALTSDLLSAARAELDIHFARDHDDRAQAAVRAKQQLDDAEQLFGARLAAVDDTGTGRRLPGPA